MKRYSCYHSEDMAENPEGAWVRYEDARLRFAQSLLLTGYEKGWLSVKKVKGESVEFNKVVLQPENSINTQELCEQLREQAREARTGSGAVDALEWKAASVIRQLLRERAESYTIQGHKGAECNCAKQEV